MMKISDVDVQSALLRKFEFFLQRSFAEIGGGAAFQHNWHTDAVQHQLDRVRLGDNRRLLITMPPRHLKSVMLTAWVAFMLGVDPRLKFICASYGQKLASKHALDCLRIMSSDWYRRAFPNTHLLTKAVDDFETSVGGGRLSTSVGGVLTGRGANIVILDDVMKADDALSDAKREEVHDWYYTSLTSRLDDQARSSIILVMQRLHGNDLAGEVLRQGGWDELRLPAIAPADELIQLTRGRYYQRRAGRPLHAERQSLDTLERKRAEEPYVFAAQYQQNPVARIGAFVDADFFDTYDEPPQTGMVVQSWDTAVKVTVRSDWSVGITARYYQGRFYILDVHRDRLTFGNLLSVLRAKCVKYGVDRLLIEDASSGAQLIQQLRELPTPGVPRPIPITPTSSKLVRFESQASKIEAGMVVLPRAAPWLADFVGELVSFPGGGNDDQADALAQMLANPPRSVSSDCDLVGPEVIVFDGSELPRIQYRDGYDPWSGLDDD